MRTGGEWEPDAARWVRWARAPGDDAYWCYRGAFFDALLPPPGARTIEIGCGEGRVTRDLLARGHRVAGVDSSRGLLDAAMAEDPAGSYVLADGAALPFADGCFEVAVAYNSLQVVMDSRNTTGGNGSRCSFWSEP